MKKLVQLLILSALMGLAGSAFAFNLQEAKTQGLVGEQTDGYLGALAPKPNAEVSALVKDVNQKRQEIYQKIAKKNGIPTDKVAQQAYQKAVNKTKPGNYYQNQGGEWVKK